MNVIFKLMIFSMMLNFSIGIMITAIPAFEEDPTTRAGLFYDEGEPLDFIGAMNQSVNPSGLLEDKGDANYRILDMLNVGFFQRFLNSIEKYVYGFVYLIKITIGSALTPEVRTVLFGFPLGVFYSMINIGYILGAFKLWTGKDFRE